MKAISMHERGLTRSFHQRPSIAENYGTEKLLAKTSARMRFRSYTIFISVAVIFIYVGTYFADPSRLGLG